MFISQNDVKKNAWNEKKTGEFPGFLDLKFINLH